MAVPPEPLVARSSRSMSWSCQKLSPSLVPQMSWKLAGRLFACRPQPQRPRRFGREELPPAQAALDEQLLVAEDHNADVTVETERASHELLHSVAAHESRQAARR